MDVYEPRNRRKNRARERYMARQSKRTPGTVPAGADQPARRRLAAAWPALPGIKPELQQQAGVLARDIWWHVTHSTTVLMGLAALAGLILLLFITSHVLTGRIFPNVWAIGVHLGDLTVEEAQAALKDAWLNRVRIQLVDNDRVWTVTTADLGLQLDAARVAESARGVGMSGIPMGYSLPLVVSVDFDVAQNFLLDLTAKTDIAPTNATYRWQGEELVGVLGTDGKMLDVPQMMQLLTSEAAAIVQTGRLELLMNRLPPVAPDPEPYLEQASRIAAQPFMITGYDPFTDETIQWSTNRDVFTSWLEAGEDGLALRRETFAPFIEAQNQSLNPNGGNLRYLDPVETKDDLAAAITSGTDSVEIRIRYRSTTYEVVAGDTGFRIARKTGIPFFLIEQVNEGVDLNRLAIGQVINLPARDVTLPLEPVSNKRIVVNLDRQTLVAFENGQPVFSWLISSGMSDYPTYPGIYQVLNHDEVALGSSFTLCGSAGCGQWEMYWFMGIYEVQPGLMNGFHGAVLLPNGAYLGGGNVGVPYTFGCVMSENNNAKMLYDWAEQGTMVEIISSEFPPQSPLGQVALSQASLVVGG